MRQAEVHYEGTCALQSGPQNMFLSSAAAPPNKHDYILKRLKAKAAFVGDPRKDPVRVMQSRVQEIADERGRNVAKNDPE